MTPRAIFRNVLLAAFLFTSAAHAQSPSHVTAIAVAEGDNTTVLRIEGESEPTYSVFTLRNPDRLFIDVANATPMGVPEILEVDNGVVSQITVDAYRDALTEVTRIVVVLERETYYDVTSDGDDIVVALDATRRSSNTTVGAQVRYSDPAVAAARDESDAWAARVAALESEVESLRVDAEHVQSLEDELASAREAASRVQALEAELIAARTETTAAEGQAAQLENADAAIALERARVAELEAELALNAARLEELDAARRALIEASNDDDTSGRLAALELELAERDAALAEARAAGDVRGELRQRDDALRAAENELLALTERAERAEQERHDAEVNALERTARIAELEAELEAARAAENESAEWERRARQLEAQLQRDAEAAERAASAPAPDSADRRSNGAETLLGAGVADVSLPDEPPTPRIIPTVVISPPPVESAAPAGPTGRTPAGDEQVEADDDDDGRSERRCRAVGTGFNGTTRTRWVPCP